MKEIFLSILISAVFLTLPLGNKSDANAAPCDAPITNPIPCENSKPGNPSSEWNISGAGSSNIQGFATDISYNIGDIARFKINTNSPNYRLDIYRMGYYGGMGARKIATVTPSVALPQTQPACFRDASTGLIDCGNWAQSATWQIPANAVSGIYFAKLTRQDATAGTSHIHFIVRDDSSHSDLLFQTSDETWQAYNKYGGSSLYTDSTGLPAGRAYKVSYNRPFDTRSDADGLGVRSFVWNAEYPMVRWLEANGYNVSYMSGVDVDRRGSLLLNHKTYLSVGHDEYWSGGQRTSVENARNNGINLAFFSGNEMFWKTRFENSVDGTNTPYRTLVTYKETHANAKIDPTPTWTGTWRDPRFSPPADGGRPENAVMGDLFTINGPRTDAMLVPSTFSSLRFWRNTAVTNLATGQSVTLPAGVLGHEWGEDLDNGFRPGGMIHMSSTTLAVSSYILDYGSNYGNGTATHTLNLYRHASGALVFGASTVQWSWGLDSNHDRSGPAANITMQQATANLFADMGVQPATLQPGLVLPTQSTDTTRPTTTITFPTNGSNVVTGNQITITGTASDTGGVVGAVEISVDNGATWHPATGTTSWTYNWTPATGGTIIIQSRAMDDTVNVQSPPTSISVTSSISQGQSVITFNDLSNPDRNLTGNYAGVNWGSASWYLSSPWRAFTTNSFSFRTSASQTGIFTFLSPRRIISIEAFNGGTATSTISMLCAGNPNVNQVVNPNQLLTILTTWTTACTSISLGSTNGWNTNFDNIIHDEGVQGSPTPTPTSTPLPTPTPTPSATPTPTPEPTSTPTPTPVVTPTPTPSPTPGLETTVDFNDLIPNGWRYFTSTYPPNTQYPAGVIYWGPNNQWTLSAPYGLLTTVNFSLPPAGGTRSMTFLIPKRVNRIDTYNGGTLSTTITLTCPGQTNRVVVVASHVLSTIQTLWTGTCTTMSINSTNGWNTNFDNLVIQ